MPNLSTRCLSSSLKMLRQKKKNVLIVQLVAHRHVVLRHHSKIAGAISSYLSLNQPTLWRIRWNRNSSSWIYFFFHLWCNRFQAANPQYRFNAETIGWQRRKAGFLSVSSAGNTGHSGPQRTEWGLINFSLRIQFSTSWLQIPKEGSEGFIFLRRTALQ